MAQIYGVDLEQTITPEMIRDAIVKCFVEARCVDSFLGDSDTKNEDTKRDYARNFVKKIFTESGGDFEKPTKSSLLSVIAKLKDFSSSFRDPALVEKHAAEIMQLVAKLKD